jgi:sugar lactone lactonase YvrE
VNSSDASILSFSALDGNVVPGTRIAGPHTGLRMPLGIAIAASRLYVANANPGGAGNLLVFLVGQTGDVTPAATISLGLASPVAVTADGANDIYVLDQTSGIVEFPPNSVNGAHPSRVISSYSDITNPMGITVDTHGNIWVAEGYDANGNTPAAIYEFASDASGAANPIATITGSQTTLFSATSVAFDTAGDLWVADMGTGSVTVPYQLVEFSAQSIAAGGQLNIAPVAAISGSQTQLSRPTSIALDSGGNLWVTNLGPVTTASVLQFEAQASGNVAPVTALLGFATEVNVPQQVALYHR